MRNNIMNETTETTTPAVRTLSHSQCETFSACPRRWHLERIERVPRAPAESLLFGSAVHAAIEADGRGLLAGKAPLPLAALVAAFAEGLAQEAAHADPLRLLDHLHEEMKLRALAVLRAYSEWVQPHYHPVAVEDDFSLPIPEHDGWVFTGRLDAITERRGLRTIVDHKTASRAWQPGAEHTKDQASAYLWAEQVTRGDEGEEPAERVTFITLPTYRTEDGGYSCVVDVRTTERTPDQIARYVAGVGTTIDRMSDVLAHPETASVYTGPLCAYCSCLGSCEDGQWWLQDRGRRPMVPLLSRDGEVMPS